MVEEKRSEKKYPEAEAKRRSRSSSASSNSSGSGGSSSSSSSGSSGSGSSSSSSSPSRSPTPKRSNRRVDERRPGDLSSNRRRSRSPLRRPAGNCFKKFFFCVFLKHEKVLGFDFN